jgi:serine/threonine protein kinase/tetratricopeptide (TPR) repeat protein
MPLASGAKLGRYEIRKQLGAGGMGEVYLAQDTQLRRHVAIKLLPAEFSQHRERLARFEQEAYAVAALNHPNIAHIYEVGEADGHHFIVMEYVDGETLREKIHRERSPLKKPLKYLAQVAEGLTKAHAAGVVHRDLKPDNIMISRDGYAKILDFGLAKLMEQQRPQGTDAEAASEAATAALPAQPYSTPGMVMGTVGYMSPEQAQGKIKEIDQRSDIFSFGCILFEAATGRQAFAGDSIIDSLHKIIYAPAPSVKEFNPTAPSDLQRIIRKCLSKEPEKRYQTMRDVANDLEDLLREMESGPEIDRTAAPENGATATGQDTPKVKVETQTEPIGRSSDKPRARPTASTDTLTGIRRHRRGTMLIIASLALCAIAAAIVIGVRYFGKSNAPAKVPIQSIAVLPFVNESGNADNEYLSDGMTESLIGSLSQIPKLNIKARNSVFRYKGNESDLQRIAQELNVQAILTGRVAQRGEQLILSLELVDAKTENVIWSERYNRKQADLVSLQSDIARDVANKLQVKLSGAEEQKLTRNYTKNTEAYQLYLRGRFYWNKRTEEGYQKAIGYFQQAIDKDPNYALAYTGLADSYSFLSNQGFRPPTEVFPLAKAAATRAIALDDTLAEAHSSMGYIKLYYDWDWNVAEQEYKRAIELNPNYATPHHGYAYYLISIGRTEEAIAEIKKAEELDPLSLIINADHGEFYYFARRPDEAIEQLRKAVEMDSSYVRAHFLLARAYAQKGQCNEAIAEFQKARNLEDKVEMLGALGQGYASCGRKDEARQILNELLEQSKQHYVSPHWIASIYAGLGEKDAAFDWLDKAFEARFGPLIYLKVNPIWDALRSDPRFAERLHRVGLAP